MSQRPAGSWVELNTRSTPAHCAPSPRVAAAAASTSSAREPSSKSSGLVMPLTLLRVRRLRQFVQVDAKLTAVQKCERRPGLRQRRQGFPCRFHDMFEKVRHFGQPEFRWMPFVVKENERTRPINKGVGGGLRIAAGACCPPKPFKQRIGVELGGTELDTPALGSIFMAAPPRSTG